MTAFRYSKEIDPDVAGLQYDGVLALPFLLQFPRRVSKNLNSRRPDGPDSCLHSWIKLHTAREGAPVGRTVFHNIDNE